MKDKEARKRLHSLEMHLSCMVIRECPECSHLTPQIKVPGFPVRYDFFCLVCGSKLKCITETVCKVIKVIEE